jgi:hypothetical protein
MTQRSSGARVIAHMIEHKEAELANQKYKNISQIGLIVLNFIRRKRLIVYGGTALNEILPAKAKFYAKETFPDYDCYSDNAKVHAYELADELYANGYRYVYVKRAIHDGTFKVYGEFTPIADISVLTKTMYDRMITLAEKDYDLSKHSFIPAPLHFLRFSLHNELSKPVTSIRRWDKIYQRYKLLAKHVPYKDVTVKLASEVTVDAPLITNVELTKIILNAVTFCKSMHLPIGGMYILEKLLGKNELAHINHLRRLLGAIDVFSSDAMFTAETLATRFRMLLKGAIWHSNDRGLQVKVEFRANNRYMLNNGVDDEPMETPLILSEYIVYLSDGRRRTNLVTVYDGRSDCRSTFTKRGALVMAWDSMLAILHGRAFAANNISSESHMDLVIRAVAAKVNSISAAKRFSTECYGDIIGMDIIQKKRWDERIKVMLYIPEDSKRHTSKYS